MSKSHLASITSKPLFISVAESMVTFFPIFHLGWFKASLGVMAGNFSMGRFKKGPPDAVSISPFISPFLCPAMDWNMALCSLSTGRMFTLFFLPLLRQGSASGLMRRQAQKLPCLRHRRLLPQAGHHHPSKPWAYMTALFLFHLYPIHPRGI